MKIKIKCLVFIFAFILIFTCTSSVTAVISNETQTTLTDRDGLDIDVANVTENDIISIEDYVRTNADVSLAGNSKIEAVDVIEVKSILADGTLLGNIDNLTDMYVKKPEAYLFYNETHMFLYETDVDSKYYVAYVNTMNCDANSYVKDVNFAYTNTEGEEITDGVYYDDNTGLAYISKEIIDSRDKNDARKYIQVELLQVVNSFKPNTTFSLKVNTKDINGEFAKSGYASVEALAPEFAIRIAQDEEAINNISEMDLKIRINGVETHEYEYYEKSGILVFKEVPGNVGILEIDIDRNNLEYNQNYLQGSISAYANMDSIPTYNDAGTWQVSDVPEEGSLIKVFAKDEEKNLQALVYYNAWPPEGYTVAGQPLYGLRNWKEGMIPLIKNGGSVDLESLINYNSYMQWHVELQKDISVADDKGVVYQIPKGNWLLKCVESTTKLDLSNYNYSNPAEGITRQERAQVFWIRIYKVTDSYLVCGMLVGGQLHNQSGAGFYKIEYSTGGKRGSAKLTKLHEGDPETKGEADIAGAKFEFRAAEEIYEGSTLLFRKDDLIKEVETDSDGNTPEIKAVHSSIANKDLDGLPVGHYYYKETKAPKGYNLNPNPVPVAIVEVETTEDFYPCVGVTMSDRPVSNGLELYKFIGETSNTPTEAVAGAQFTATADESGKTYLSTVSDNTGYCKIEGLPYGHYTISETTVPPNTRPCSDFTLFVEEDSSERGNYTLADVNFVESMNTYEDTPKEWTAGENELVDEPEVMQIKIRKQDQDRTDSDPVDYTQGDAKLQGAKYQVYQYNETTKSYEKAKRLNGQDYVITVDHKDSDGYWVAESDDLLVGKYMVKELVQRTDIGNDGKTYKYSYAKGYLVDETEHYFAVDPKEQNTRISYHYSDSMEQVIRASVKVVKYDNQENNSSEDKNPSKEVASKGAKLRLVLNSSIPDSAKLEKGKETEYYKQGTIWYEVKLDKDGFGEFLDKNDESHETAIKSCYGEKYYDYKILDVNDKYSYSCTIPYGEYTIIETKESDYSENTSFYIKPVTLKLYEQTQIEYKIESDEPVPMYLKIQKRDTDTGATVELKGAKFKIWDCENEKFITQLSSEDASFVDVFETNEYGLVTTPERLLAGDYIIYEVDTPRGYYWEDDLRLPRNPNDIGVIGKGGKHIVIDKTAMEIRIDTISNEKHYFYTVDILDRPLKSKIEIIKKGEMLDGYTEKEIRTEANDTEYTVTNPEYEYKGLANVEYTIIAKNDIKSPDGRVTYEEVGTPHIITTDENGYAITEDLYLGTYEIKETKTPLGYVTDKNIPDITLVNEDKTDRVKTATRELFNKKQPTQVEVEKVLENPEYDIKEDHIGVVIGLYANEDLYTPAGNKLISKNTLLDVVEGKINTADIVDGKNSITLTSNVNLPNNKTYYAKELYVDYPYEMETEKQVFEVKAKNTDDEILKIYGITINNEVMDTAELAFVKISTSALINEAEVLKGGKLTQEEFDKLIDPIIKWVNSNPASTVKAVFNGEQEPDDPSVAKCRLNSKYTLSGAIYSVYYDEAKTQPLTKKGVPVTVTTDSKGYVSLPKVPIGEYYIFEEVAPVLTFGDKKIPYEKEEKPIRVILSQLDKDNSVARLLSDEMIVGKEFIKTDIFTGELIPECTFEITNSDDEVIVNAITDKEGKFYLSLDWFEEGETYFYKEISAPETYDLNTEPHEFKIEFDENGKLIKTEVENIRKTRDLLIRKTDAETGELLQGCVFTIAMINEDGSQKVNAKTGEPIYLVENAVTDENGEYYIEDAPMGTYMFTEITPPEGYELDEDLTGYIFTLDKNSPDLTIFEVTNTGDIAVIALACVAVVCVLGIAFVIIKNKKSSKK